MDCTWEVNSYSAVTRRGNELQRFYFMPGLWRERHAMQEEHGTISWTTRWWQRFSVMYCHRLQQPCSVSFITFLSRTAQQLLGYVLVSLWMMKIF